MSKLRVNTV